MIFLGYGSSRLVDASMLCNVDLTRDLILSLWIRHNLFVLQHQSLSTFGAVFSGQQLVMRSRRAKSRFLGAVSTMGIFSMLEVEANLVKSFFADKILAFGAKVSAVDDGVDEFIRVRAEVTTSLDAADTFEAKSIPDTA